MSLLAFLALASALDEPTTRASLRDDVGAYFSADDYPPEALRNEEQGTVAFRLDVTATGAITGCSVTKSSGSAPLDAATCRIMTERPRFVPARNKQGTAVAGTFEGRIRWLLPDDPPDTPPPTTSLRAINNIWEVTADGRQRSCRRELVFEAGDRINADICLPLDTKFVAATAAYLQAPAEAILTIRLENRWLLDPVLPFSAPPLQGGQLLARGEGSYRLNADLSVRDCAEGRFSARFTWKTRPCFRKSFAGDVPLTTTELRLEVQWVVSRGPDTERPAQMPMMVKADGQILPLNIRRLQGKEDGPEPR